MTFDKVTSEVSVTSIIIIAIIHSSPGSSNSIAQ